MGSYTAALFLPAAVNKDEIVRNSGKKRFFLSAAQTTSVCTCWHEGIELHARQRFLIGTVSLFFSLSTELCPLLLRQAPGRPSSWFWSCLEQHTADCVHDTGNWGAPNNWAGGSHPVAPSCTWWQTTDRSPWTYCDFWRVWLSLLVANTWFTRSLWHTSSLTLAVWLVGLCHTRSGTLDLLWWLCAEHWRKAIGECSCCGLGLLSLCGQRDQGTCGLQGLHDNKSFSNRWRRNVDHLCTSRNSTETSESKLLWWLLSLPGLCDRISSFRHHCAAPPICYHHDNRATRQPICLLYIKLQESWYFGSPLTSLVPDCGLLCTPYRL